jgi:hypothetical protein
LSGSRYAIVVEIIINPGSDSAHRLGVLDEFVLPELRGLPGYFKSLWLNDGGGTGTCIVVFDDAERARAGLEVLTRDGGPPVVRAGVHEIEVEDL